MDRWSVFEYCCHPPLQKHRNLEMAGWTRSWALGQANRDSTTPRSCQKHTTSERLSSVALVLESWSLYYYPQTEWQPVPTWLSRQSGSRSLGCRGQPWWCQILRQLAPAYLPQQCQKRCQKKARKPPNSAVGSCTSWLPPSSTSSVKYDVDPRNGKATQSHAASYKSWLPASSSTSHKQVDRQCLPKPNGPKSSTAKKGMLHF